MLFSNNIITVLENFTSYPQPDDVETFLLLPFEPHIASNIVLSLFLSKTCIITRRFVKASYIDVTVFEKFCQFFSSSKRNVWVVT